MQLRGIIQSASLEENPPQSELIEMILQLQGVGPGQPRRIVIPYALLLEDETIEPENVTGRRFDAEVRQESDHRWLVTRISLAARMLRPPE